MEDGAALVESARQLLARVKRDAAEPEQEQAAEPAAGRTAEAATQAELPPEGGEEEERRRRERASEEEAPPAGKPPPAESPRKADAATQAEAEAEAEAGPQEQQHQEELVAQLSRELREVASESLRLERHAAALEGQAAAADRRARDERQRAARAEAEAAVLREQVQEGGATEAEGWELRARLSEAEGTCTAMRAQLAALGGLPAEAAASRTRAAEAAAEAAALGGTVRGQAAALARLEADLAGRVEAATALQGEKEALEARLAQELRRRGAEEDGTDAALDALSPVRSMRGKVAGLEKALEEYKFLQGEADRERAASAKKDGLLKDALLEIARLEERAERAEAAAEALRAADREAREAREAQEAAAAARRESEEGEQGDGAGAESESDRLRAALKAAKLQIRAQEAVLEEMNEDRAAELASRLDASLDESLAAQSPLGCSPASMMKRVKILHAGSKLAEARAHSRSRSQSPAGSASAESFARPSPTDGPPATPPAPAADLALLVARQAEEIASLRGALEALRGPSEAGGEGGQPTPGGEDDELFAELERRARRIRETMETMDDSLLTASPAPSCRSGDSGGEAALLNDYRNALAGAHAEIANLQAMLAQCSDYMERAEAKFLQDGRLVAALRAKVQELEAALRDALSSFPSPMLSGVPFHPTPDSAALALSSICLDGAENTPPKAVSAKARTPRRVDRTPLAKRSPLSRVVAV